ncbi:IclR family transcriptional regulator [Geodermatophilus tzadiensis]|uniref:IclR family transcriptional regulator n=1 Tax=Geodermatophilus tzadiensis TaxID=1137988 RepID=A0A2T0TVJ3_9ACTN|nr:IclR family transcriptional regulator [Geodermatophilus tzadiensis]
MRSPDVSPRSRSVTLRATAVLGAFDAEHRTLNLSQLSRRSGLPLATVHRLAADLVEGQLLVRRGDGRYEIGARLWRLGLLAPATNLRELALPHLQDLVVATGHTVHLVVPDGAGALVIERLSGTRSTPTRHNPGARLPLHCTAVGKVLLAFAPGPVVEEVTGDLRRHTAYTVTDVRVLHRQLDEIRRTGLARSAQEHRLGVSSVAVPVHGTDGVTAAIGLLASLTGPRLTGALPHLRAAAASVSADLLRSGLAAPSPEEPPAGGRGGDGKSSAQ